MRAVLGAVLGLSLAGAAAAESAGGPDYHVVVQVPAGWRTETAQRPFPRVLLMSPSMPDFDRDSAQPMARRPDQIVCGFSRAVKKDPVAQTQAQINAGVRRNFEDLKSDTWSERGQDILLFDLIEDQGMVGAAVVFVGTNAENYGYLYASSTFDTPLYQYKGDCIGKLSEGSSLKGDIVAIIGSMRPAP